MLNNVVQALGQLALIIFLLTVIVFFLVIIFAMVDSVIQNFKMKKFKNSYLQSLDNSLCDMLKDLDKQKQENTTKTIDKKINK